MTVHNAAGICWNVFIAKTYSYLEVLYCIHVKFRSSRWTKLSWTKRSAVNSRTDKGSRKAYRNRKRNMESWNGGERRYDDRFRPPLCRLQDKKLLKETKRGPFLAQETVCVQHPFWFVVHCPRFSIGKPIDTHHQSWICLSASKNSSKYISYIWIGMLCAYPCTDPLLLHPLRQKGYYHGRLGTVPGLVLKGQLVWGASRWCLMNASVLQTGFSISSAYHCSRPFAVVGIHLRNPICDAAMSFSC